MSVDAGDEYVMKAEQVKINVGIQHPTGLKVREQITIEAKYTLIDIPPCTVFQFAGCVHSCLLSLIHALDHEVHALT